MVYKSTTATSSSPQILPSHALPWRSEAQVTWRMSAHALPDHVCYVQCKFCNTILVVSVPGSNLCNLVTVRCGHCTNLLSVNMGVVSQPTPPANLQDFTLGHQGLQLDHGSSSIYSRISFFNSISSNQLDKPPTHPPEKRQRIPSAYNRFIKEEIRRLKATNPHISHREAFSAAAKNWAHFPRIHFGLNLEGSRQVKIDDTFAAQKSQAYY